MADCEKPDEVVRALGETVGRIAAAVRGPARALEAGEWTAGEILAHLRGCADVWPETIAAMLNAEEPELPLRAPREWARKMGYARLDFEPSFRAFAAQRAALLDLLSGLPAAAWERGALIGGRRHTVLSQARRLALHEQAHCEQLEARLEGGARRV
jgi:hypothetical protein